MASGVPRQVAEVGGMLVQSTHAARGKQSIFCKYGENIPALQKTHHPADAFSVRFEDVHKFGIFHDFDVGKGAHQPQKLARDLLARHVVMEKDARARVSALPREAEVPLLVPGKVHAVRNQFAIISGEARIICRTAASLFS